MVDSRWKSDSYLSDGQTRSLTTNGDLIPHSDLSPLKPGSHGSGFPGKVNYKTQLKGFLPATHPPACTDPVVRVLQKWN